MFEPSTNRNLALSNVVHHVAIFVDYSQKTSTSREHSPKIRRYRGVFRANMSTKGISLPNPSNNGANGGYKTSFFADIHKQLGLLPGFRGLSQDMNKLDQETQTPGSGSPLDSVRSMSETIATDLIMNYEKDEKKPSNKYCKTMRRTVRELSNRHDTAFKGMVNKLKITETNAFPTFVSVVDEIFEDGQINWGRIVAVYTFAARLAQHCKETCPDCDERISLYAGKYVANKLGRWIHDNGGWDAFVDYFPEQGAVEDKIWKGLVYTAFGLGALATMVATH